MTSAKSIRYEFRAFMADLSFMEQRFESRGILLSEARSEEIYILNRLNIDTNLKIRDGKLELKTLQARKGVLELWKPTFCEAFPISPALINAQIASVLGMNSDFEHRAGDIGIVELTEAAACHENLAPLRVEKKRRKFQLDRGFSEIVRVSSGPNRIESAAVESDDLESADALIEEFGLRGLDNLSYPAFLQWWAFE